MTYPMRISPCTSTIETAVYVNRTHGGVRGRELVTPSYSIGFTVKAKHGANKTVFGSRKMLKNVANRRLNTNFHKAQRPKSEQGDIIIC